MSDRREDRLRCARAMSNRTDPEGYSTKVTALPDGWGCRVYKNGKLISERKARTKQEIGPTLREMLRMIDKSCNPSSMASASRDRRKG